VSLAGATNTCTEYDCNLLRHYCEHAAVYMWRSLSHTLQCIVGTNGTAEMLYGIVSSPKSKQALYIGIGGCACIAPCA
jgi:hypothetical protein